MRIPPEAGGLLKDTEQCRCEEEMEDMGKRRPLKMTQGQVTNSLPQRKEPGLWLGLKEPGAKKKYDYPKSNKAKSLEELE